MFISGTHRKAGDALFGSVSLLLHGNASFADSSANNFTPTLTNTPTIDTTTKKYGAGSMKFVRASVQSVSYPFNNATAGVFQDAGSGTNATVELWFNFTSGSNYSHLIGAQNGTFGAGAWSVVTNYSNTGSIDMWFVPFSGATPVLTSGAGSYNDGNWHHLAITKQGTTMRMFIDGALVNSNATVPAVCAAPTQPLYLGTDQAVGRSYDGFLDDVRITAGAARYTSAFTPPSAEFPNS